MRKVTEEAVLPSTGGLGIYPNKLEKPAIGVHLGTPAKGWKGLDPNLLAMPAMTIYTGDATQWGTPLISKKCGSLYMPINLEESRLFIELNDYMETFEESPALPQMRAFTESLKAEARKGVTHHVPFFEITGDCVKESVEYEGERYPKIDSMDATFKAGKGRFTTGYFKASLVTQFNSNFYKNPIYKKDFIDPTSGGGGEYGCFFPQRFPVGEVKKVVDGKKTNYYWSVNASPNFIYCSDELYRSTVEPHILSIMDNYVKLVSENEESDEYEAAVDYCKGVFMSMHKATQKKNKVVKPPVEPQDEEEEDFGAN